MAAAEAPPDEANATRDPWDVSSEEGSEEEEEEEEELDPHRFDAMSQDVYDPAPDESANYGKADFWDERYMFQDAPFEWYHSYETLSDIIGQYIEDPEWNILICGCGNSNFVEDMVKDGYTNVTAVDFSRVVIDQMQEKYEMTHDRPCSLGEGVTFKQMNCCDMQAEFNDKAFQVVIEKAMIDAMYCAETGTKKVLKALDEIDRVLVPNGVFISISYARPEIRLGEYDNDDVDEAGFLPWAVEVATIPKPTVDPYQVVNFKDLDELYFLYICEKDPKLDKEKDQKKYWERMKKLGKTKKNKKGAKPARMNKRKEAKNLASMNG